MSCVQARELPLPCLQQQACKRLVLIGRSAAKSECWFPWKGCLRVLCQQFCSYGVSASAGAAASVSNTPASGVLTAGAGALHNI